MSVKTAGRCVVIAGLVVGVVACSGEDRGTEVVEREKPSLVTGDHAQVDVESMDTLGTVVPPDEREEVIVRILKKPADWPAEVPFRPRRHFGQFREGSELSKIQILVHASRAGWFYNDFFDTVANDVKEIYKIYFRFALRNFNKKYNILFRFRSYLDFIF